MVTVKSVKRRPGLSVVIPTFNSEPWLPSTLDALATALAQTSWPAEVVVIDDGSTDETLQLLNSLAAQYPYPLRVIPQVNQGRFMARWNGAQAATFESMLLLDSRIPLRKDSLAHIEQHSPLGLNSRAWNGHATTDPTAPLIGHFWEVPTYVFWASYLSNPQFTVINSENFTRVPKGTTFFLCPTQLFLDCCLEHWPDSNAALTNDDTKIIRTMSERIQLVIDPGFAAVYRPRTNLKAFIRHTFARGTTFVDGFAGVKRTTNLVITLMGVAPLLALTLLIALLVSGFAPLAITLLIFALVGFCIPAAIASKNHCPRKGVRAYFAYAGVFAIPYWLGLCRGLWIHRNALFSTNRAAQ